MDIEDALEIKIVKKADDPLGVVRVSLGGGRKEIGGWYLVYRGTKEQAIEALRAALYSMERVAAILGPDREPDIAPDDGKRFS